MSTIHERIKKFRKLRGMTQQEFADKINASQQVITNYERGLREPDIETLVRMAEVLKTSVDELVGSKPVTMGENTNRALIKRLEKVKAFPHEKQKAFISFVDALSA